MKVHIEDTGRRKGAFASEPVQPGEAILPICGTTTRVPQRFSLQIGEDLHILPRFDGNLEDSRWCFVNHSCQPNCHIDLDGMTIVATTSLARGEELFFDYCSTEYDMAS